MQEVTLLSLIPQNVLGNFIHVEGKFISSISGKTQIISDP